MSKLSAALVAFQAEVESVGFDSLNPHFKNKYASYAAIRRTIKPLLEKHRLAVTQFPISENGMVGCITRIIHESGESVEHALTLPMAKSDPQGAGAAISYARRYGLSGALGLVTEEDEDAETTQGRIAAVARPNSQPAPRAAKKAPAMSAEKRDKLKFAARERMKQLTGDSGTADEVMTVLTDVAKDMGHASPIEMTDAEFGHALEAVQKWEPQS